MMDETLPRTPEPELMNETGQALAYADADFSVPHGRFIDEFRTRFAGVKVAGQALDLGCGPADITIRFAEAFPDCNLVGIDGAPAMLAVGQARIREAGLEDRVRLLEGYLPGAILPHEAYDIVLSNSLLHHINDPRTLWEAVRQWGKPNAPVFIMDLQRPASLTEVDVLVETHATGEPEILRRDFRNSLHAAYTPGEVVDQLAAVGLSYLKVETVSDRHWIVWGQIRRLQSSL